MQYIFICRGKGQGFVEFKVKGQIIVNSEGESSYLFNYFISQIHIWCACNLE